MEPGADVELERPHGIDDRLSAADRSGGTIEGGEEPVAGCIDLLAVEAAELTADGGMVLLQQVAPAPIADLCRSLGGADEVGEEHRREHAVRAGRLPPCR